jgi:hypothetical protein
MRTAPAIATSRVSVSRTLATARPRSTIPQSASVNWRDRPQQVARRHHGGRRSAEPHTQRAPVRARLKSDERQAEGMGSGG